MFLDGFLSRVSMWMMYDDVDVDSGLVQLVKRRAPFSQRVMVVKIW